MRNNILTGFLILAVVAALGSIAFAGGPLIVDAKTRRAYHYDVSEAVPIYYDRGNFGLAWDYSVDPPRQVPFSNWYGKRMVEKGFGDWGNVATSSLRTTVRGNFSQLGLPNITASNITQIIGKSNGRGVYVVFDEDGSIMSDFFGVGPSVLGISTPQYGIEGTTIITESWAVLNGSAIDPADSKAAQFQGVATHEFGHALGLAHTQTNGSAYFYGDSVGPASCSALPYPNDLTSADVETMYPFINPTAGSGTGAAQGRIHTLDTIAAISDLYPGAGWPTAYGAITGKIFDLDGTTELTGVNVIARNVADPFVDAVSAISGQLTQGELGPDGTYTLHGLKPGAKYVVYADAVMVGGFSTPPLWFLPGAEKFFKPNNAKPDYDPCKYKAISASPGSNFRANIRFDHLPGSPVLYQLGYGAGVTGMTGDGTTAVGNFGLGGAAFRWTRETGVVSLNVPTDGVFTSISRNGKYISTNLFDTDTFSSLGTYRWDANNGWIRVKPLGSCGSDTTYNYGVSNSGAVYGLAYTTNDCRNFQTFRWTPSTGTLLLPSATTKPDGSPGNGRPNQISGDGSTIVGWEEDETGSRIGVVWRNGVPSVVRNEKGEPTSEAFTTSSNGQTIGGGLFLDQQPAGNGWRRRVDSSQLEYFAPLSEDASPINPYAMSRDGKVMAGFSGNPFFSFNPAPFIWTKELGTVDLNAFIKTQGTSAEQWFSLWTPMVMSDDGSVIAGWGLGTQYFAGWVLEIKTAFVCHAESPSTVPETISVSFPVSFDQHLGHGDTVGRCPETARK